MNKAEACAVGDLKSPGGSCLWASQNQQSPSFLETGSSWQVDRQAMEVGKCVCGCGVWLCVSAVCVCSAGSLASLCSGEFQSLPSCVFAVTPNHSNCGPAWTAAINQCTEQCVTASAEFFPDTHPTGTHTYCTPACYCVRRFDGC